GLTCKTDIDIEEIKILNGVLEKYTYLIGIEEILVTIKASNILNGGSDDSDGIWYNSQNPPAIGLAAPVETLLKQIG
ncbi:MAG: hypothetical protein ACRCS2_08995, partial [Morganella morganii]